MRKPSIADIGLTKPLEGPPDNTRAPLIAGLALVLLLLGAIGGWAATASLAGAVVATGTVIVDTYIKKVQHPTGGVIQEIRIKDGDRVRAGDLLIRLDETVTRANLQVITKQLDELEGRQARLKAERDGATEMVMPLSLMARHDEPEIQEILQGERTLFESRRAGRAGQTAQLGERVKQLKEEIGGLTAQQEAKAKEIGFVKKELDGQHQLWIKKLLPITKYTATQREATRLEGERAQLIASAAQARGKIAETELQILQLGQDLRTEVIKDLREAQGKVAELNERRVAAEDQLKRIDIRAPQAGIVHQLAVHTVGGVITQSEPIMLIVPEDDALMIEARIAPQDIDHVRVGQPAFVRFTAFNQRTTPEFNGIVSRVSADLTKDSQANLAYYVARITLPPEELQRLGALRLVPGMPAEVHIRTAERTALSYFLKPLSDQFARAFREH